MAEIKPCPLWFKELTSALMITHGPDGHCDGYETIAERLWIASWNQRSILEPVAEVEIKPGHFPEEIIFKELEPLLDLARGKYLLYLDLRLPTREEQRCSNCGKPVSEPACSMSHALLAHEQGPQQRAHDALQKMEVGENINFLKVREDEWHVRILFNGGLRITLDVSDPIEAIAGAVLEEVRGLKEK